MNKRPGQIKVTVETGYCSFCDRTRNLRREERQLGALIRTVVACESCHRLLSSTIGVADADTTSTEAPAHDVAIQAEVEPTPAPGKPPAPKPKASPAKAKPAAAKPGTAGAKPKAPAKGNRPAK